MSNFLVGTNLADVQLDKFNGDTTTVAFTLSVPSSTFSALVRISGVVQTPVDDYNISGTSIVFTSSPPSGSNNIVVTYTKATQIGVPNDASVSSVKIQDGAITAAKIATGAVPSVLELESDNREAFLQIASLSGDRLSMSGGIVDPYSDETDVDTSTSTAIFSATKYVGGTNKTLLTYTGSDQTFTVPAGVSSINVKLWGAGGGSGDASDFRYGGGGGFVKGDIAVTPSESLTVIVGQAGSGATSGSNTGISSGGGRSALRRSSTELFTAGAGGGGGRAGTAHYGGVGGGLVAGAAPGGAGGGTQSAGGATVGSYSAAGSQFQGGRGGASGWTTAVSAAKYGGGGVGGSDNSTGSGRGGGGGYYGGGGGDDANGTGAGGGSSFIGSATNTTNTQATTFVGAGQADVDYPGSVGDGSNSSSGLGENGYAVIAYPVVNGFLVSNAFTAATQPDTARIYVHVTGSGVVNTDLTAEVSRDGGTTWTTATLTLDRTLADGTKAYSDNSINISGQPSGTSMKYRLSMLNDVLSEFLGTVLQWS